MRCNTVSNILDSMATCNERERERCTNVCPDYIISDENQYPEMDHHYLADSAIPRNNLDNKRTNTSGKSLLNICKETDLKLVNGRSMGDRFGNFTFHL